MWLENQTRPDIANVVRAVARYANEPRGVHWRISVGFLGYICFFYEWLRHYVPEG